MRVVVALGGNALLRRGEPMTAENQRANVSLACSRLAAVATDHELVISHGNGPQIGLLALEGAADPDLPAYPLDILGAETQGMIGYLVELDLGNRLPAERMLVTVLTMIEVDPDDPAFADPSKPIGPIYDAAHAEALASERGWTFRPDGDAMRRVVPSPAPKQIIEHRQIRGLLDAGCIVICAGGGGIPTVRLADGGLSGTEAVIDKDAASALLSTDVGADLFVMATDTPAAYLGFGTSRQEAVVAAHPDALLTAHGDEFAAGSMLPKVAAACDFARRTGRTAVIGRLEDIEAMVEGRAGTCISTDVHGVHTTPAPSNPAPAKPTPGSKEH